MRRPAILIFFTACVLALTTGSAVAATTGQIMVDFNADDSIDGNYTLAELRAANAAYPAAQREYFDTWEIAYRAAVKRVTSPPDKVKPPVVPPKDENQNGMIDPAEEAAAATKTAAAQAAAKKAAAEKAAADKKNDVDPKDGSDTPEVETVDEDDASSASDDDDSRNWGLLLVLGLIVLAAAVAIWRVLRHHRKNAAPKGPQDAMTTSELKPDGKRSRRGKGPKPPRS
ncbi:MAG: hypothetical protein JWM90_1641 [Thermoleophilia bacterium]|nr:hypothetical protein [Thermoleophilia bacterium]